ncbi:methylmalonyl-CoA mutase [Neorhizobium sp. P12A]|uniref:methylmalonyl-CoA mutase family protein n=1 Tax=Rhizobium/Agrobacterium group TaxID=227290 RepID=UPI00104600A5|nr:MULTISPECIES: methylmalonyl-CoA mutase family protein [Rhizobium/Agrobacterium group]KAA0699823.1 methylmalonyl-CoA mutase [Neorhizobium sp. P12A]TCR93355.1 heterodimeric methylmalonyl-CoA mutase small subunit [Rhizobium sp. BK376]
MKAEEIDANAFGPVSRQDWLKVVERALKGADFAQTLVSASDDGIAIEPLYQRRQNATPQHRRRPLSPWVVSQRMDDPDLQRAFVQLDNDLANGATGVSLVFPACAASYGLGLDGDLEIDGLTARLATALSGRSLALRLEGASPMTALSLADALSANTVEMHFGLGVTAMEPAAATVELFRRIRANGTSSTVLKADGRSVHNAGGTEAQELAVMAAALIYHLRRMETSGIGADEVLSAVGLCLAADQDQFMTIAKARAARLIFARIAEACGVSTAPSAYLFMETSYRMLTRLDPETNLLRNTIAVFAAGVGGADEISVLPHTLVRGIPDPLARRLARNTQTILIAESHLDHVSDPAAGAGGIEALTEALAEKAWEIFTGIERDGGLGAVMASGRLASRIAETRANRPARQIVGTNLFPAKTERPVSVLGPLRAIEAGMGLRPVRLDEEGSN